MSTYAAPKHDKNASLAKLAHPDSMANGHHDADFDGQASHHGNGNSWSFGHFKGDGPPAYHGALHQQAAAVPEPTTYALALCGLGLVGLIARYRRRV